jgi:hypothetical protein
MRITQRGLLILILALAISGCGTTQPAKFYLLNASSSTSQNGSTDINIGVGPIEFPTYLERSKIMIRTGNNSFKAAEYHRWAEPLDTNFTRVLAQELHNNMPNANVNTYPKRNSQKIDIQVLLEVLSFDSDDNNQAQLNIRWELLGSDKKPLATPQQHQYTSAAHSSDYDARVTAMSECVTALGQALAQEINHITSQ